MNFYNELNSLNNKITNRTCWVFMEKYSLYKGDQSLGFVVSLRGPMR